MKSASRDLRNRVVEAYRQGGTTYRAVALRFCVGEASVSRWLRLHRETGDVEPRRRGGGQRPKIDEAGWKRLRQLVERHSDATLAELATLYRKDSGVELAISVVHRALDRLGLSRKKKVLHASEQEREDVKLLRWHFVREQERLDIERLWFFDESGVNLSMTRPYGRGLRGERVVGHVPKNWGSNETLMAAIGVRGLLSPMVLHGSLTGSVFEHYMRECVVPSLAPGDVFVLDNLAAHKTQAVRCAVEQRGARLLFLPPYSPDFNPIELAWSKIKTLIRGSSPRTLDDLVDAVAQALHAVAIDDIRAWLRHCGYSINS